MSLRQRQGAGSGSLFGVWFGGRFAFQVTVIRLNHWPWDEVRTAERVTVTG